MAKSKLLLEMIIEMKKTLRDMEKLAGSTKKATKELRTQGKQITKTGKHFDVARKKLNKFLGGLRAFTAALTGIGALAGIFFIIGKAVRAMVVNTIEGIQASAKLEAVLKATGHAAGVTKGQLDDMSFAMSQNTTFTQTSITEAQGIMATFTKLGKETFPRAISAASDMSTMFGQTLQQSSIQLGTALNDPINGIGRLMRIGVSFSESQKKQIEAFMAMGDVASAQGVILAELEAEMGGAAEAMGDTLIGQVQLWANNLALAGEQIGVIITMIPQLKTFIEGMNKGIGEFVAMPLEQRIAGFFSFIRNFLTSITSVWSTFIAIVNFISTGITGIAAIAGQALKAVVGIAGMLITGVSAIIEPLFVLFKKLFSKENWKTILGAFDLIGKKMKAVGKNISAWWHERLLNFLKNLNWMGQKVADFIEKLGFKDAAEGLRAAGQKGVDAQQEKTNQANLELADANREHSKALRNWKKSVKDLWADDQWFEMTTRFSEGSKELLSDAFSVDGLKNLQQELFSGLELNEGKPLTWLDNMFEKLGITEEAVQQAVVEMAVAAQEDKKTIEENNKNLEVLNNSWLSGAARITNAMEAAGIKMDKLGNSLGKAFAEGGSVREIIGNAIAQTMGNIAKTSTEKSMADWVQGQFAAGDAAGTMAQGLTSLMGGLAGGLVGGLIGKLFRKKPKPIKKPIPVKVVNWGDMTQHLLKASMRRAVSPMITTSGNSVMSANFSREARI
jgi:hypothetical protein